MFDKASKKNIIFLAAFLTVILFLFSDKAPSGGSESLNHDFGVAEKSSPPVLSNIFEPLKIEAKSVYVLDLKNKREIFSKNAEVQLPLASLTKLMTAFLAADYLSSDASVVISENAIIQDGDNDFFAGQTWPISDLVDFMLVSSSNDAAFAIAEKVGNLSGGNQKIITNEETEKIFVRLMNQKAREFNLTQTFFLNSTGLDMSKRSAGAFGSAKDIAFLMERIIEKNPDFLSATRYEFLEFLSRENKIYTAKNTNKGLANIFQIIGGKTGFTDISGGNLAVVVDIGINHPAAIVVLGSSEEGRFADTENLVRATYKWFEFYK